MIKNIEIKLNSKDVNKKNTGIGIQISNVVLLIVIFLISRTCIMEELTPFGIALFAALTYKKKGNILTVLITTLGIISVQGINGVQYLMTLWILFITYNMLCDRINITRLKLSIYASVLLGIVKTTVMFLNGYLLYDGIMIFFECIIVFALSYIFTYSIGVFDNDYRKYFSNEEVICTAILMSLVVAGIGDFTLFTLSIKNIVALFIIIMIANAKGASMGTTVGVTIGLITSISAQNVPLIISVYAFSGLLAGLFKEIGLLGSCVGFIMGNSIMSLYINGNIESVIGLREIFISSVFFIIYYIVEKRLDYNFNINFLQVSALEKDHNSSFRSIINRRLCEFSEAFSDISKIFDEIADKERFINQFEGARFIENVCNDVCADCSMHRYCWKNDFFTTYHSMFDLIEVIETEGKATEDTVPEFFNKRCMKVKDVVYKSNYLYDLFRNNYKWENKVFENRKLISQQFEGVSKSIKDLAKDVGNKITFNDDMEKDIYKALKDNSYNVKDVSVIELGSEKFEIYINLKLIKDKELQTKSICEIVSNITGYELRRDSFYNNLEKNNNIRLKLVKANRYRAMTCVSAKEAYESEVSGDSYTFGEKQNTYFAALSDGMGVGEKAQFESKATISLLEKFLEAGFDKELALKNINSILVMKSDDEVLSTIDLTMMDLYSGKGQFIKTGSAPTFLKKKNEVNIINSNSLPVGILNDVDFNLYEEKLEDGDFIIMMSDGVLDSNQYVDDKEKWMSDVIKEIDNVNPKVIANKILNIASNVADNKNKDDMTVVVTKVWKKRN